MVKKIFLTTQRKIIFSILILGTSFLAYPLLKSGYNSKTSWRLDADYSEQLTIDSGITGSIQANTVDVIRIYRTFQKHDDMFSLHELFKKDLVFESADKQFIKKFILAAQQIIMHIDCNRNKDGEYFHVVFLDNKQMRAGYFLFIRCESDQYAIVRSLQKSGGANIYYNSSLLQIFKSKGLDSLNKPGQLRKFGVSPVG